MSCRFQLLFKLSILTNQNHSLCVKKLFKKGCFLVYVDFITRGGQDGLEIKDFSNQTLLPQIF